MFKVLRNCQLAKRSIGFYQKIKDIDFLKGTINDGI